MLSSKSLLAVCCIYILCACTSGKKCNGSNQLLRASFEENFIYSPGYPQKYEISDSCSWVVQNPERSRNLVIQLVAIDIDLNDVNEDCSTDFIIINEGRNVDKWCGPERKIFRGEQSVNIQFQSDEKFTGKGFVISYSLITNPKIECDNGSIKVGDAPVYASFQGQQSISRCEWHIQATSQNKLRLDLFKPSAINCDDGFFDFYDGANTKSHVSFKYCSTMKPFSSMFLTSDRLVIIFQNIANTEMDNLILKISSRSSVSNCNEVPVIEVKEAPVILALPLALNDRNVPCLVRLQSFDGKQHVRLDVMATNVKDAECGMQVVRVREVTSNKIIEQSCNRGKNPVYRSISNEGLVVEVPNNSKVFLRATAVDDECDGGTRQREAYHSVVQTETIPAGGHYFNLDYCRWLISAEKENEVVLLSLSWKFPANERRLNSIKTVCQGDFINIYDGVSETSPVLYSTCWLDGSTGRSISMTVKSSQRYLLVVLDADGRIEGNSFNISFHSIPEGSHCSNVTEILVSREVKTLTSPNYPNRFPLNQVCIYNLVSENPDDDIVVKITEANLHDRCKNFLAVYEGEYNADIGGQAVGRACGNDNSTFKISSPRASLVAVSEDVPADGGWKVEIYTEEKGKNSAGTFVKLGMTVFMMLATIYLT